MTRLKFKSNSTLYAYNDAFMQILTFLEQWLSVKISKARPFLLLPLSYKEFKQTQTIYLVIVYDKLVQIYQIVHPKMVKYVKKNLL